jgi:hypothetical protein
MTITRRSLAPAIWGLLGLIYALIGLTSLMNAKAGAEAVYYVPIAAGTLTAVAAGVTLAAELARGTERAVDIPEIRATLADVAWLCAILGTAWLVMPYLGLVLSSLALFLALAAFYRDQSKKSVAINLVLLFCILVFGAVRLLGMPLLRSSLLDLPF